MSRYTKRMSDSLSDVHKRAVEMEQPTPPGHAGSVKTAEKYADCGEQLLTEVAPPGWGHTKAEKSKTDPDKPKSKIGGSAHEFDKDLKSGKFKGLPGDKTMKDKRASMFKLMWSMKNKGDKPHYKPGEKGVKKEEVEIDEQKPQHPGQKKGSGKLKKGWGMTQSGEPYFKPNSNRPTRDKKEEVEVDEVSLNPAQRDAREKARGSSSVPHRVHGGTPGSARAIGVKTDHQQRGQKKTAKPHKYGSGVDAAGGQHTSVGRYGDKARPGRISKMAYAKKKEEVEMDETGRAASAASDPRVDTGSSSVDTVPGYEKKFIKTQKRVGRIPEEHDCEKVHPNLTHKDWEAEKNEAADTWHPDPVKDKKSTSYKHHARQMATQAMKKATKPDTFGHLKITPAQLAARRRVRATEETINEAEWEVKLKGLPAFYIPAKSAGAVKQMLRKQLKRPMDDIESVTRATPAAKKKDFRQRAQGKPSAEEDRG